MRNVIKRERVSYEKLRYNRYIRKTITLETITGWAFLSPLLIVAIIFSTTTIVIGIWLTFQGGDSMRSLKFVGLKNWKFLSNPNLDLGLAFKNTLFYAIISVPTIIGIALVLSAILNSRTIKNKELFLAMFFLPQVTSAIASTLIFKQLFAPNGFIKLDYRNDPTLIIWVVIISATWGGVSGSLITFNTAFASIDKNQYEAANLDGAHSLKKFLNITLPSIGPIISYSLFMGIIGGLGVFDGPYLLAATSNINPKDVMTIMLKGFLFIQPQLGTPRMGLGTTILFLLAFIMAGATMIFNFVMPMNRRTN